MFKKVLFGMLVAAGLVGTAGKASAHYPYYGGGYFYGPRPIYGTSSAYRPYGYYPHAGHRYGSGYGYGYGYPTFSVPVYTPYVYSNAPVYFTPRGSFTYVTPRVGVSIGF